MEQIVLLKTINMTPLKKIRIKKGMTLNQVVQRLAAEGERIDTGNLSRVERGMQQPSTRLAEALTNVFAGQLNEMHVLYPERYKAQTPEI